MNNNVIYNIFKNLVGGLPGSEFFSGKKSTSGFAILYVMIIIMITLAVSLATITLIGKEMKLARVARESLGARSAADTGLECVLALDKYPTQFDPSTNPTFTKDCGRNLSGTAITYNISCGTTCSDPIYTYTIDNSSSIPGPCFKADIKRDTTVTPSDTIINIFGYNTCDSGKVGQKVERGIIVDY